MNLRQWLVERAISHEEASQLFGVTPGVVESWLKHGVPRTRRPDVVARTSGEVKFYDEVSPQESAINHIEAAILGFESVQVRNTRKQERIELQHYIQMLYRARDIIEG